MKKIIVFIMLVFFLNSNTYTQGSKVSNWVGFGDSLHVVVTTDSAYCYTRAVDLTGYEDMRVTVFFADTTNAGYSCVGSGDSINSEWGIQTANIVFDSGFVNPCTLWTEDNIVVIDTVDSLSIHSSPTRATIASDLTVTYTWGWSDTTNSSNHATQDRPVLCHWNVLVRGWMKSLGGRNLVGDTLSTYMKIQRRKWVEVH